MISADRISRRFGDRLAVEDVSFDVRPGEVFGLLGPNGAGKTTILRRRGYAGDRARARGGRRRRARGVRRGARARGRLSEAARAGGIEGVNLDRVRVLIAKELREFRANPSVFVPVLIVVALTTILPIVIVVILPNATGQSLASDRGMQQVVARAAAWMPALAAMPPEAATEALFFQQFLFMFLIAPIIGEVSLAAYAVVGEKQGRTLEPLLTTPVSTAELLVAKALASFVPALLIEALGLCIYGGLVAVIAVPGVLHVLLSGRTLLLVTMLGPIAALAALQATIAVSSRVNDPRSAQQIAVCW